MLRQGLRRPLENGHKLIQPLRAAAYIWRRNGQDAVKSVITADNRNGRAHHVQHVLLLRHRMPDGAHAPDDR